MRHHTKLALTAFAMALVFATAVSAASARRLEISNTGIRIAWSNLRFSEAGGEGVEFRCPVTIEGTFHSRTISKVSGQLIGFITSARLTRAQCTFNGGVSAIVILNGNEGTTTTLPWHIRYDSFAGALPRIESIRFQFINVPFLLTVLGIISCLYKSTTSLPFFASAQLNAAGQVTGFQADATRFIPLFAGPEGCPPFLRFEGTGTVTLLNNTSIITIRLVA